MQPKTPDGVASKVGEEHRKVEVERPRQSNQDVQARSLLAALEIADVVQCDGGGFGQPLLRPAALVAMATKKR